MTPRSTEELEDLRMLVASAVGLDTERGDEITIRSMAFEALPELGTEAGTGESPAAPLNIMKLVQTGILALVALILGLFVVRPVLTSNRPQTPLLDDSGSRAAAVGQGPNGTIIDGTATPAIEAAQAASAKDNQPEDHVERLRGLIDERREEAIQVLQSWIDEPETSEPTK